MKHVLSPKCFAVAQEPTSGVWRHYLCGWHGTPVQGDTIDPRALPVWLSSREQALKLDAAFAQQLVAHFDKRYGQTAQSRVVVHSIEELPEALP